MCVVWFVHFLAVSLSFVANPSHRTDGRTNKLTDKTDNSFLLSLSLIILTKIKNCKHFTAEIVVYPIPVSIGIAVYMNDWSRPSCQTSYMACDISILFLSPPLYLCLVVMNCHCYHIGMHVIAMFRGSLSFSRRLAHFVALCFVAFATIIAI